MSFKRLANLLAMSLVVSSLLACNSSKRKDSLERNNNDEVKEQQDATVVKPEDEAAPAPASEVVAEQPPDITPEEEQFNIMRDAMGEKAEIGAGGSTVEVVNGESVQTSSTGESAASADANAEVSAQSSNVAESLPLVIESLKNEGEAQQSLLSQLQADLQNLNPNLKDVGFPEAVDFALTEAPKNGGWLVDAKKMNPQSAAVIFGMTVKSTSTRSDPVVDVMLKLPTLVQGKSRLVKVSSLLSLKQAIDGHFYNSYLLPGQAKRVGLFDYSNKKSITLAEAGVDIKIGSMCEGKCSRVLVLVSVVQGKKVLANSYVLLNAQPGRKTFEVEMTSLGARHVSFAEGLQKAEADVLRQRAEEFARQKKIAKDQLIVTRNDLMQKRANLVKTIEEEEDHIAMVESFWLRASQHKTLEPDALRTLVIQIKDAQIIVAQHKLRLIDMDKQLSQLDQALKTLEQ